jgi:hypothetical protein
MATFTYNLPTVGGSEDTWGTTLNANWTALGTFLGSLDSAELAVLDGITATTAELNILDGFTGSTADLEYARVLRATGVTSGEYAQLSGLTANTNELNILDGNTAATATTLVDADRLVTNDGGAMRQVAMSDVATYTTAAASSALLIDEDDMASDSDTQLPTQQSVKAYVDAATVGAGQTWQDVSGSRSAATSYQNTSGKPIMVSVAGSSTGTQLLEVSTDNATWVTVSQSSKGGADQHRATLSAIIPTSHYYRCTGISSIDVWAELR